MRRILVVFGTRAEWLKLYPIYYEWNFSRFQYSNLDLKFYWTKQHEYPYFDYLHYDYESSITKLDRTVSRILFDLEEHLGKYSYDLIMVQGDTFSTLAGAFLGFLRGIPVIHVEAGLRTYRRNPFPEERIRVFVDQLSQFRFCPTMLAAANLSREDSFFLKGEFRRTLTVGNTIVDMVNLTLEKLEQAVEMTAAVTEEFFLCSLHRRESWKQFGSMLEKLKKKAEELKVKFLFVFHPNKKLNEVFSKISSKWVKAVFPQSHLNLIFLMKNCLAVVTDSGGMIEEAAVLKKPCFILREETEREESLKLGLAKLIGRERGISNIDKDFSWFQKDVFCPYGDGTSSLQILRYLNRNVSLV
jgi:UDP-N-acetylglucosamine 2-epimerase (non-hydrolysing)